MAASGRPEVASEVKFVVRTSLIEIYLWSKFGDRSFLMHKMLMCVEDFRRYGPAYLKKFLRYNFRKDCSINMKIGLEIAKSNSYGLLKFGPFRFRKDCSINVKIGHDVAKGNCYSLLKFGAFRLSRS